MTPTQRKQMLISILVTQLRDEHNAFVDFESNYRGEITALALAVPYQNRAGALPLFHILKMYLAPAYKKRRKK